jgi:phosphohistidine phosphatase SixA
MKYERRLTFILVALAMFVPPIGARAQTLSGETLVSALRQGGYVIVMRHASSPRETPDKKVANADNVNLERQLDEIGRTTSTAFGKALRDLKIPIGEVLTSPTYRALETVRLAQLPSPKLQTELGDGGQSMQAVADAQAAWLQKRVTQGMTGSNVICVTHMPNISRAFPSASGVADGEALVFRPDGKGGTALVGRIKIEEWSRSRL